MHLPEETQGLVLIERGAEVPSWLDCPGMRLVEQLLGESDEELRIRACLDLEQTPACTYVVVVLSADSHFCEAHGLEQLGSRLVSILATRSHPRLLLCVAPTTHERKRKALLALARDLAQAANTPSAVLVGAHFSARPPQSETLPVLQALPKRRQGNVN